MLNSIQNNIFDDNDRNTVKASAQQLCGRRNLQ